MPSVFQLKYDCKPVNLQESSCIPSYAFKHEMGLKKSLMEFQVSYSLRINKYKTDTYRQLIDLSNDSG